MRVRANARMRRDTLYPEVQLIKTLSGAARLVLLLGLAADVPAQSLGVYHWAGQVNSLPRAVAALERFQLDTIRVFLGGKYDYVHAENAPGRFAGAARPLTLARIAQLPRYRALFENPSIHTVWLTAYPVFDYGQGPAEIDLRHPVPEKEWQQEGAQVRELVEWLYRRYGSRDRVVLISNHETDEKMREVGSPENIARDLEVRMKAGQEARSRFPRAKLKVLFGVEVKLWRLKLADGTSALQTLLPALRYDFVSFSAWEVVSQPETLAMALDDIARRTRDGVTPEGRAFFGEHHVLVGEFGQAREWPTPPEPVWKAFLGALSTGRTLYAIYWQLYDNATGDVKQFGLLDPQDRLTTQGKALFGTVSPIHPPSRPFNPR